MKKNIRKKLKGTKGITLVALVVTIIVLLILAAVSLSAVFSQDGIFSRAEQGADKHGQAKARETLELALGEAQMQKYEEGLTEEQLDNKIGAIEGELLPKEKPEYPNLQNVIVDGYIFEIDRSVPKIVDYIGPANGVIITAVVTKNGNWQNPVATLSGTIKKYGGGTVTSSTATATEGVTITGFPTAGGNYTIPNITKDTDITITASADDGKPAVTKTIKVRLVRDTTGPTIKTFEATSEGLTIIIKAMAEDTESGMQELTYNITSTEDTALAGIPADKRTGTLEQGKAIRTETTPTGDREETTYKVTVTAKDNAGNSTTSPEKEVKTEELVYKYIKTAEGLKKVKTRDIYGSDVLGYTCNRKKDDGSNLEWQIFYIDETKDAEGNVTDSQVYLIAKDFMAPPTTDTEMTKGGYLQTYYWNSTVLDKYKTILPASNTTTAIGRFMGKFLSDYAGTNASSQTNLQATNYMIDQTMWEEYKGAKADLAFGGPTLPLFQASYNDIAKKAKKIRIQKGRTGYQVKLETTDWSPGQNAMGDENTQKGIYFKGSVISDATRGMWLASPSSGDAESVMDSLCYNVSLSFHPYNWDIAGFRPIICLKSTIQFIDNGNGTYTIN